MIDIRILDDALARFERRGGDGGDAVYRMALDTLERARGRAPRRTGALIEGLVIQDGVDARGYYADVVTTVHRQGYAYGTEQELLHPYLRPSLK